MTTESRFALVAPRIPSSASCRTAVGDCELANVGRITGSGSRLPRSVVRTAPNLCAKSSVEPHLSTADQGRQGVAVETRGISWKTPELGNSYGFREPASVAESIYTPEGSHGEQVKRRARGLIKDLELVIPTQYRCKAAQTCDDQGFEDWIKGGAFNRSHRSGEGNDRRLPRAYATDAE